MMPQIDPITLEVVTEALVAVVREMRVTTLRTAYASIISEGQDFSCAIFGPDGQMVAQSEDLPAHVIPIAASIEETLKEFPGDLSPGDLIMINDPFRGGTHLNDVAVISPVFVDGKLFILPAIRVHWPDIGGMTPGSLSGRVTDIYQEGIRIPPIKIAEKGRYNRAAMDLLFCNVRMPEERLGDFYASVAACNTAERRLTELARRYGPEKVLEFIACNQDRSEARMRERILQVPDGTYRFEDYMEFFHDGLLDAARLAVAVTVDGSQVRADFAGSSPQQMAPVNQSIANTVCAVFVMLKSILDPDGPVNHGVFRPVSVAAPESSIVHAFHPAPAGSCGEVRKRVMSAVLGALSQVIPEQVAADFQGTANHNMLGGRHPRTGKTFVYYEYNAGGNGAFSEFDGNNVFPTLDQGDITTVQSVESIELEFPLQVMDSGLRIDSGGAGTTRGGLGHRRAVRLLSATGNYSCLADRAIVPPFGLQGGASGVPNDYYIVREGKTVRFDTPGKVGAFPMRAGDTLVMETAGGGGFGDPLERSAAAVRQDVRLGYVSRAAAQQDYGVVLTPELEHDAGGTQALRNLQKPARHWVTAMASQRSNYDGVLAQHRVLLLHPATAARFGLSAGQLAEIHGLRAAPLRALSRELLPALV